MEQDQAEAGVQHEELVKGLLRTFIDKVDDDKKEDKNAFKKRKVKIARQGTKIILPSDPRAMTEDEAIEALQAIKKEEQTLVKIHEEVACFPLEGAWALRRVLERMFGYVMTAEAVQSFFGTMPSASLVNLEVGPGQFEQVLWGKFKIPGMNGELQTGAKFDVEGAKFVVSGTATIKDQETIKDIADEVRAFLKTNSLYKGKAIKVRTIESEYNDKDYEVDFNNPPSFMDLTLVNEEDLIFSADVMSLIQTNIFTPLEKTEMCRKAGIPLKRSILLEGPYGTGKTLTAFVAAKKAVQNGWTFVYMDRAQALKDVLIFARRYAPVAIFCEDIEQVTSDGRSTAVNDVLNNIDGIDSKGHEVISIFTTNHVEKIEPAMLRAGRLDAVITVLPPDAKAAERLIRTYSKGLMAEKENLKEAAKELAGQIPAFIRETVERAKLYAINHAKDDKIQITGEDIRIAAIGMKNHFALVNRPKSKPLSKGDELALALINLLKTEFSDQMEAGEYYDVESATHHRLRVDQMAEQ